MIVVTWLLKPLWGRSRPFQTLDFGGYDLYTSFADWGYKCSGKYSFVSGEVASMAWLLLAVQILPKTVRPFATTICLILLAVVSWGRIASGRHFATDAIFAIIVVVVCHCIAKLVVRKFLPQRA
jgi:membrane-associated phospholipid phosphatase